MHFVTRYARVLEKKEERCATPWSVYFGLILEVFWYALGDHDALAFCYLEDLLLVMTLLVWRSFTTCWRH